MARYSANRVSVALSLASCAELMAPAAKTPGDRYAIGFAATACEHAKLWAETTTEASRRIVLANATAIRALGAHPALPASPFTPALDAFADALTVFAVDCNDVKAGVLALTALRLAQV